MKPLSRLYNNLRCIPKTLFFNFYYLPFLQAIRFPVLISHRVKFQCLQGSVIVPMDAKMAQIKIGFGKVQVADHRYSRFVWNVEKTGVIELGRRTKIGTGCKLYVSGRLSIGDGTNFSGETSIICKYMMTFGQRCLIAWQAIFMDTDYHRIVDVDGVCLNPNQAIVIGDDVWICARCTFIKGVSIGSRCLVSISSNVVSSFSNEHMIGGNPAKVIGTMKGKKFCH
ncbi:MAG: hypothetical protein Q9M19_03750 [Mariprofundaceae bacterium]|nr:hypothetical protein [Mariprofundaceae bacterium]